MTVFIYTHWLGDGGPVAICKKNWLIWHNLINVKKSDYILIWLFFFYIETIVSELQSHLCLNPKTMVNMGELRICWKNSGGFADFCRVGYYTYALWHCINATREKNSFSSSHVNFMNGFRKRCNFLQYVPAIIIRFRIFKFL